MTLYRRRLPHVYETEQAVFLTWRLHDSLPSHRAFPTDGLNSGQAFAAMDRLLDEACSGAFYLRQPALADVVVGAIQYNADMLGHYLLHAFVVMPNHVHFAGDSSRGTAETDEIVERHHGQTGQRDAGLDGKPLLAGRELRSPGAA
jgi:hypothetical protein